MAETIDGLKIRQRLGRQEWAVPVPFGPDGFRIDRKDARRRIIVSASPAPDQPDGSADWIHASISGGGEMPSYDDLQQMHRAVWPDGWAYQMFAPPAAHVNIHPNALHLWGRADGSIVMPNFGMYGTI